MTAWEVTKIWDASRIQSYRRFVAKQGPKRTGNARFTCEDLAIRLVTEFAAAEGLPLVFANDAHPTGLSPTGFADKDKFLDVVLTSTGASDLLTYKTVMPVPGSTMSNSNSLRRAAPGDLIILYRRRRHVQVVTAASPTRVTIVQGNFRPRSERCSLLRRLFQNHNQNRPSDRCYIGEIVRQQTYRYDAKAREWLYSGSPSDVFKDHGQVVIWNFVAWNQLAPSKR